MYQVKNTFLVFPHKQTSYTETLYELYDGTWVLLGKQISRQEAEKLINNLEPIKTNESLSNQFKK